MLGECAIIGDVGSASTLVSMDSIGHEFRRAHEEFTLEQAKGAR